MDLNLQLSLSELQQRLSSHELQADGILALVHLLLSSGQLAQARQVLVNLAAIATAAGTDIRKAIKTTIFLTDLSGFAEINKVYGAVFDQPYPARSTIEVSALPKGGKVEIEAIIALD